METDKTGNVGPPQENVAAVKVYAKTLQLCSNDFLSIIINITSIPIKSQRFKACMGGGI